MNRPHITRGWLKPSLKLAATLATALTISVPMAPSALSSEPPEAQPLQNGMPLKEQTTQFVPEVYKGMVCMAIAPQCMTKKQWAAHCLSNKDGSANLVPKSKLIDSQSCRDALDQSAPNADV